MSSEAPFPLRLEALFFTKSVVIAVPGHVPVPGEIAQGPTSGIHVERVAEDEHVYQVTMRVTLNLDGDKQHPYTIDMECVALFRNDGTLTHEAALRGCHITGHSVVYGAIREAIGWITSRQPYGSFLVGLSVLKSSAPNAGNGQWNGTR